MPLFGKKKPSEEGKKKEKAKIAHVVCPHCFVDFELEDVEKTGGVCPSCKGKMDLEKLPKAYL